jgi:transmembrane sensor
VVPDFKKEIIDMNKNNLEFNEAESQLITNYISGECSEAEQLQVEEWIKTDPSVKNEVESLKKIYNSKLETGLLEQTNDAWDYVHDKIHSRTNEIHVNKYNINPLTFRILKAAAILLVIIGGYFISAQIGLFKKNIKPELIWVERAALPGERLKMILSDSSTIILNADSRIKYPDRFINNSREIYLEGEAFFEVSKDTNKPFIVRTGEIITTVLGTKFNVKAYSKETEISVSLVEGKVKVSAGKENTENKNIILKPSQQLTYNKVDKKDSVGLFDEEKAIGWKDKKLKFEKEPLEKILIALERSYGVKFELADKSYASWKVSANFNNASITSVIEVLKNLTNLKSRIIRENDIIKKVIFYKK